jgi:hypothetical protein
MHSNLIKAFLLAVALSLGGCAATVTRGGEGAAGGVAAKPIQPAAAATQKVAVVVTGTPTAQSGKGWADFRGEYRNAMAGAAAAANLQFAFFEGEVPAQPAGTTLVKIKVNDYRYLSTGARIGLGIFTGNAFVDSDVEFVELPANRVLGTRKYSTSSSAWQGVFSAMTDAQLKALSAEIVKDASAR